MATRIDPCRRWDHHPWPSTPPEMEKKKASVGGREGAIERESWRRRTRMRSVGNRPCRQLAPPSLAAAGDGFSVEEGRV